MIPWRLILGWAALVVGSAGLAAAAERPAVAAPAHAPGDGKSAEAKPANANASKTTIETGPAVNWTWPVFSDKEGYRQLTLRGSEARIVSNTQIDVTEFSAVVFSGDASERVDTVLLSPQATFYPRDNRAAGSSSVRLILSGRPERHDDDVEVTGRGWTYDHSTKKVSIAHDVRVTFNAQLHDILK